MWWEGRGVGPLGALGCDLPARAEPMAGTWTWTHTKTPWIRQVSPLRVAGDRSLVGNRAAPQAAWPSALMGWAGSPGADMRWECCRGARAPTRTWSTGLDIGLLQCCSSLPPPKAIPRGTQISQIPLRHLTAAPGVFAANLYYWEP